MSEISDPPSNDARRVDQPSSDSEGLGTPVGVPPSRYLYYGLLTVMGAWLDLWSKYAVFEWRGLPGMRETYWVVDGYFGIQTAVNPGAVFGIGAGMGVVFAAISFVAMAGILVWLFVWRAAASLWMTTCLGMITGGIIGNLYDRLGMWWFPDYPEAWRSGVRDWILWQASDELRWPNFNIADSLLVTGAIMLMIQSIFFPPDHLISDNSLADHDDPKSSNAPREAAS